MDLVNSNNMPTVFGEDEFNAILNNITFNQGEDLLNLNLDDIEHAGLLANIGGCEFAKNAEEQLENTLVVPENLRVGVVTKKDEKKPKNTQKKRIISPCPGCSKEHEKVVEMWHSMVFNETGYELDDLSRGMMDEQVYHLEKQTKSLVSKVVQDAFCRAIKASSRFYKLLSTDIKVEDLAIKRLSREIKDALALGVENVGKDRLKDLLKRVTCTFSTNLSFIHRQCIFCKTFSRVPSTFLVISSDDKADSGWYNRIGMNSHFNGGPGNCAKKVATRKLRAFRKYLLNQTVDESKKIECLEAWNSRGTEIYEKLKGRLFIKNETGVSRNLDNFYNVEGKYRYITIFPIQITRSSDNFLRVPKKSRSGGFSLFLENIKKNPALYQNNDKRVRLREDPEKVFAYDCFMTEKIRTHQVREDIELSKDTGKTVWVAHVFKDRSITKANNEKLGQKYDGLRKLMRKNFAIMNLKELKGMKDFTISTENDHVVLNANSGRKVLITDTNLNKIKKKFWCTDLSISELDGDVKASAFKRYKISFSAPKPVLPLIREELLNKYSKVTHKAHAPHRAASNINPILPTFKQ